MSLVATVYVREGIVMAADSRLTLNATENHLEGAVVHLAVGETDSIYKLFLAPHNIGISTFGDADIQGVPIAGYIETFVAAELENPPASIEEVANKLLQHFAAFDPAPATQFHVAGYVGPDAEPEQQVWVVDVVRSLVSRLNPPGQQGCSWGGEGDIVGRILQPAALIDATGAIVQQFPVHQIPWGFFTLQDAIDFAVFAIRSTTDAIRFQQRPKTVGGPIDVLVIKPSGAMWIQRKELQVRG